MNKNNLSVDQILDPYRKDMNKRIDGVEIHMNGIDKQLDIFHGEFKESMVQVRRDMGALREDFQAKLQAFMEIILAKLDEVLRKLDSKADSGDLNKLDRRVIVLEEKVNKTE